LFIHTNYIKLNSSTCFERNPLIIRRSTTQIVHKLKSEMEFIKRKYLWPNLWYICDIYLAYLRRITKNS